MRSSPQDMMFASSGQVFRTGVPSAQRAAMSDVAKQWQAPVKERLEQLIRLQEGWDGYAAFPVSFDNAMFAYTMLESICRGDTPPPQIVPGPSGDLQIEWHTHQGNIELWVRGPNNVIAWYEVSETQEDKELELTTDFSVVSGWIQEVTEKPIAFAAAA